MSTVEEIKSAMTKLSIEERAEIISELCGWKDDHWDRQMKADVAAGKFDSLNSDADRSHASAQTVPLDKILEAP